MFVECRDYLIKVLKDSGIKKEPFKNKKQMKLSEESHMGAVLFDKEILEKDFQKRIFVDEETKKKRQKSYKREISFSIIIGEYEIDKVQAIYEKFLELIVGGIVIKGNYIEVLVEEADWLDNEDSIIKSKCAVQFIVRFIGGVYKDTAFKKFNDINVEVEREASYGEGNQTNERNC